MNGQRMAAVLAALLLSCAGYHVVGAETAATTPSTSAQARTLAEVLTPRTPVNRPLHLYWMLL